MTCCSAIVVAAGKGRRFKSKNSKLLFAIRSKPILVYSLEAIAANSGIKDIVIVVNRQNMPGVRHLIKKYKLKKISKVVLGGKERQDSVRNGLKNIPSYSEMVLIHDAARPFVSNKIISDVIRQAKKTGAAVAAVPVKATIKEAVKVPGHQGALVKRTIDRSNLWEIQTPQVFERKLIEEAFLRFGRKKVTDEAMLVERLGRKVAVVGGSYNNLKITTPEDLVFARAIAGA